MYSSVYIKEQWKKQISLFLHDCWLNLFSYVVVKDENYRYEMSNNCRVLGIYFGMTNSNNSKYILHFINVVLYLLLWYW